MENKVQRRLSEDHRNVASLLSLMSGELDRVAEAENADFDLLGDIMRYLTTYPDTVHHRLEDEVYGSLREIEGDLASVVQRMWDEHRELTLLGQAFNDLLQSVSDGQLVEREKLVLAGRNYVAYLHDHMVFENQVVFPAANEHLSPTDWEQVAQRFETHRDPLFGPILDEDFANLVELIRGQTEPARTP